MDQVPKWLAALNARHRAHLNTREFLKAIRALSARYVEQRHSLAARPPLDSAGKRAAFAAFYAPIHFFTTREIVRALGADHAAIETILDLGCGTGTASAAWALAAFAQPADGRRIRIEGIDKQAWAVDEAAWNWRQLTIDGRARRSDLVEAAERRLAQLTRAPRQRSAVLLAWSVNELEAAARDRLLPILLDLHRRGAGVLVIEPLARGAAPWWDDWTAGFTTAQGRADEWKFDVALPDDLAAIDAAAGFRRDHLGARTLWLPLS